MSPLSWFISPLPTLYNELRRAKIFKLFGNHRFGLCVRHVFRGHEVSRFLDYLKKEGVRKGDRHSDHPPYCDWRYSSCWLQ